MTLETQAPTDTLLVLTQNAWGQAPGWERRKARLVRKIAELRPHVVGLQEVHAPSAATGERSQAHEIAEMVGGYDTYFAPGRVRGSGACEGVAVLCRCDVREHSVESLTLDRSDRWDGESQRIVLCVTIELPVGTVDVFVTHLSLSERARRRTMQELLRFVIRERDRSKSRAAVLMGDLNAHPDEWALGALTRLDAEGGPWRDAWRDQHGPKARGGTWPAFLPLRRLDYIFVQPGADWQIESCDRIPFSGSDHLGVLGRLRLRAGAT